VAAVYLIDFGMARIAELAVRTGATNCGSTYYMSPEVRNGMRQDERVDVWSAGVFMFEMYGKDARLYSTLEVHSMNAVNENIYERIDDLVGEDDAWRRLIRAVLTPKIELKNSKMEVRKSSEQVVEIMQQDQFYLMRKDMGKLEEDFRDAGAYTCSEDWSEGKREIMVEIGSGFVWDSSENYHLHQSTLR
jgi:serine/threonine protein kinase